MTTRDPSRCDDVRSDAVAYVRGELQPLANERVKAHLQNCGACRALFDELQRGLEAARDVPPLSVSQLDALTSRALMLSASNGAGHSRGSDVDARYDDSSAPFVIDINRERGRRRMMAGVGVGLTLAAVAAAALLVVSTGGNGLDAIAARDDAQDDAQDNAPSQSSQPRAPVVEPRAPLPAAPPAPAAEIVRSAPSPSVRMLASSGFDGDVEKRGPGGRKVHVEQRKGFAVFAFHPANASASSGNVEQLEVHLDAGTVRAVGTLFFVDVDEVADVRRIGVSRGRVVFQPEDGGSERVLNPGDTLAIDARGTVLAAPVISAAQAFVDDEELVKFHDDPLSPATSSSSHATSTATPAQPSVNVAEILVDAERLTRAGKPGEARALLSKAAGDKALAARSGDVLRYEIARLDGFSLGQADKARGTLRGLEQNARSPLRVQATLTLCELDLPTDRCAAKACLGKARAKGGFLGEEAARLEQRWALRDMVCEH